MPEAVVPKAQDAVIGAGSQLFLQQAAQRAVQRPVGLVAVRDHERQVEHGEFRNLFSKLHIRTFEILGFDAVTLDVRDLVPAVQTGAVDAQDNPLTNIRNFGFLDHHRWITLTGHFFGSAALLCHAPSYDSWPTEIRAAVDEAAVITKGAQRGFAAAEDEAVLAEIDPEKNEIIHLTDEERTAFVAAVRPLVDEQRERFGEELIGYLD
jgi:TRAP-type C4-dicarboxylate transport system substrate-binding protein